MSDILSNLQDIDAEAFKTQAMAFLSTVVTASTIHKAQITLGGMLLGTNASTGIHKGGVAGTVSDKVLFGINIPLKFTNSLLTDSSFTNQINSLMDELKDPNIEGIPIKATKEEESTNVTVSKQLLIDEVAANKRQVVDSAMPELREWNIQGYITTSGLLNALDGSLIIKPGLIAQRTLLQTFADSRRPVWYKTHDNRFYKVLITEFSTAYDPKYLNGIECNIRLTEFKTLSVDSDVLSVIISAVRG